MTKEEFEIKWIPVISGRVTEFLNDLNSLFSPPAELYPILGLDNPYPLRIVLEKLKWATNYLLHEKNYDGHVYEELNQCVHRAEEIISCLEEFYFNQISIKSFLIWLEKEGGNPFTDKDALIGYYLQGIKNEK